MNASLKWCKGPAGVLRIHLGGGGYGSAFEWSCSVEKDDATAILHGVVEFPELRMRSAIAKELLANGFTHVRWLRVGKGWKKYSLRRWYGGS